MILETRQRQIDLSRRPLVMGIVNINDDSFCGDGTLDPSAALALAEEQIAQGADVIDIGAESARTNRGPISEDEECRRIEPFMRAWETLITKVRPLDDVQTWPPLLSVNTWRPTVVEHALRFGAEIINDISALPTDENARLCAHHNTALLIMHSVGQPKVPHTHVQYASIMDSQLEFFADKIKLAQEAGLKRSQLILDPGIDFAKQRDDNLTIYRELERLHCFEIPILVPVSRKTVIHHVLDQPDPRERDAGTVASIVASMLRGAQMFRVHNVSAAVQAIKVCQAILKA